MFLVIFVNVILCFREKCDRKKMFSCEKCERGMFSSILQTISSKNCEREVFVRAKNVLVKNVNVEN